MDNPFSYDLELIKTQAQKAAWEYDDVNDACPYPFASMAGVVFKEAFLAAQAAQAGEDKPA